MNHRNEIVATVANDQTITIHSGSKMMANQNLHRMTRATRKSSAGQTINLMKTIDPVDRMHLDAINATGVANEMVGISMTVAV